MQRATRVSLSPEEERAYDAPYPSNEYTAAPRQLPYEVPFDPTDTEAIENQEVLRRFKILNKPFMTVFVLSENNNSSTDDGRAQFMEFNGAQGQIHDIISEEKAGHYIREDIPLEIVQYLIDFIEQ